MEWVTGVKLTGLPPAEIQRLVAAGQEAFLTQLLEVGFFHGDPHPGNLLKVGISSHAHPPPFPPFPSPPPPTLATSFKWGGSRAGNLPDTASGSRCFPW